MFIMANTTMKFDASCSTDPDLPSKIYGPAAQGKFFEWLVLTVLALMDFLLLNLLHEYLRYL